MVQPESIPRPQLSAVSEKVVEDRDGQIAVFMAAMEGHTMNEELQRVFTKIEESEPDPEAPEIDASVFGAHATIVAQLWERYRAWSSRVYMTDIFNDNNRRQWRLAFQQQYGHEGNAQLKSVLDANKYKVAPVSGLNTILENLCIQLERGSEEDRALAAKIDAVWSVPAHLAMFGQYLTMTDNEEKKRAMAQFGREFSQALDVIAEDAQRRAERAA